MLKRRIGNDIPVQWSVLRNGSAESFSGKQLRLYIYEIGADRFEKTDFTVLGNVVSFTWLATEQKETGRYSLILEEYVDGNLQNTIDVTEAILLVEHTEDENGDSDYIGDASCTFTSEISVAYGAYTELSALVQTANQLAIRLNELGITSDSKGQTLLDRINSVTQLIEQIREFQLTYGEDHPYIDNAIREARIYTDRQWGDVMTSMSMLRSELLEGFSSSISPVTIQTMQAVLGTESLQYEFIQSVSDQTVVNHQIRVAYVYNEYAEYSLDAEVVFEGYVYKYIALEPSTGSDPLDTDIWSEEYAVPRLLGQTEDYPVLICPYGVIKHYTFGIEEVRDEIPVTSFHRWRVLNENQQTDTIIQLPEYESGYRLYIKASDTVTPDAGSAVGGIGSASFFLSKEPMIFEGTDHNYHDEENGLYYLLYALIGDGIDNNRSISYWNGYTEINPGMIRAYRFVTPDGLQYLDFKKKQFYLGDSNGHIQYNQSGLEVKGNITVTGGPLSATLASLQSQIDGNVESFYGQTDADGETFPDDPSSAWTTPEQKEKHLDDTYTNLSNGRCWRYTRTTSTPYVYSWTEISDTAAALALRNFYEYNALLDKTIVSGGLVLTNFIQLGYKQNGAFVPMAGIYGGNLSGNPRTIASWYGGAMVDHETYPTATNYAKTLFRMDGTGYLADGNITWNTSGYGQVGGSGNNYAIKWNENGIFLGTGILVGESSEQTMGEILALLNQFSTWFEMSETTGDIYVKKKLDGTARNLICWGDVVAGGDGTGPSPTPSGGITAIKIGSIEYKPDEGSTIVTLPVLTDAPLTDGPYGRQGGQWVTIQGGGTNIPIQPEPPTDPDIELWVDTDDDGEDVTILTDEELDALLN